MQSLICVRVLGLVLYYLYKRQMQTKYAHKLAQGPQYLQLMSNSYIRKVDL